MNKLSKLLPALALVLGATLAMAMNFAHNPEVRYAEDPAPGTEIWYDLTDITPGPNTHECNQSVQQTCSFEEPMVTSSQVEQGEFIKNGSLPLAHP